jgi:uncharacterized protein (DUF302 family)
VTIEAVPALASEPAAEDEVLGQLMLGFSGLELPRHVAQRLMDRPAAGVTLFRRHNVASAAQVRTLTSEIQAFAPRGLPFLVAVDQEGGQLLGLGEDSTPFAGNMALGAVGDSGLAERVGRAIGTELRACGANVNYAPVCDLATNMRNPGLGVRSFGDDPDAAARLVGAFVHGLSAAGVAATLKQKLDVDFPPYAILGACNPPLAHQALTAEPDVGLLLPCNVVVRSLPDGRTMVEALDPVRQLAVAEAPGLEPLAADVRARMERVIDTVGSS